jgi:hypothetical protein
MRIRYRCFHAQHMVHWTGFLRSAASHDYKASLGGSTQGIYGWNDWRGNKGRSKAEGRGDVGSRRTPLWGSSPDQRWAEEKGGAEGQDRRPPSPPPQAGLQWGVRPWVDPATYTAEAGPRGEERTEVGGETR